MSSLKISIMYFKETVQYREKVFAPDSLVFAYLSHFQIIMFQIIK